MAVAVQDYGTSETAPYIHIFHVGGVRTEMLCVESVCCCSEAVKGRPEENFRFDMGFCQRVSAVAGGMSASGNFPFLVAGELKS